MTTKLEDEKMTFNSLKRTNQKLAVNPNLSDHNKQVLEDFFKKSRSGGSGKAILRDYSSRFNKLADHIDFQLDNPENSDLQEIYAQLNTDEIRKNNGEAYSDYSKDKFDSALSKFYTWFVKKQGKGYNPDIDGEMLEVMSSERESFETFTGKLYAFLFSDGYGTISRIMYVLSDADSSKYDVL